MNLKSDFEDMYNGLRSIVMHQYKEKKLDEQTLKKLIKLGLSKEASEILKAEDNRRIAKETQIRNTTSQQRMQVPTVMEGMMETQAIFNSEESERRKHDSPNKR
jgi:transposase-like protein